MSRRAWVLGAIVVVALAGAAFATRPYWTPGNKAQAQQPASGPRAVPVEVATAARKKVPVRLEALGNVTPIASVAVRARVDSEITAVHFRDGAAVKEGDLLFTLDSRTLQAQVQQAEGNLKRDQAQLEGAERDVRRYTDLVAKGATPVTNLDNAKTQADSYRAAILADQGALNNLKVQLSYTSIRAPISGRMSAANFKVGNFVRMADIVIPLATIIQTKPIYVSFSVPQKQLADVRQALGAETATVEAVVPGSGKTAAGQVTMIENTVDTTTGMVMVRATMPNDDELLWPGTLVTTRLTLRVEDAVVVPSTAVQVSQTGNYVFVIKDNVAHVQRIAVERNDAGISVIASGLQGGETVVTDGQLLLSEGTKVNVRKAGS